MKDTSKITNCFISCRVTDQIKHRLECVAEKEMLSVSDVIRRSVLGTIRDLEERHQSHRPKTWSIA